MDNSIKILEKLLFFRQDSLRADQYSTRWYGYQQVKEKFPELSQEEFKKEIASLHEQHYIEVEDIRVDANRVMDGRIIAINSGVKY
ncbi:MAG: hypothetical protein WA125_14095 [Desulfosporosinus sp.]